MVEITNIQPVVSIFCTCKNSSQFIRKCIESVLNQDYPNIEFVVQDGASTDGTLEILKEYGDKIKLVSEPDSGASEGNFLALKRCSGDIIGSCLSDEELLPHAVSWAVNNLAKYPDVGAIYGDVYVTDLHDSIIDTWVAGPFSLKGYLRREFDPPLLASFFRRKAFLDVGLFTRNWALNIGEFEFLLRIGMKYPIRHVPGVIGKYSFYPGTLSYSEFLRDDEFVSIRRAFFEKFFDEPDLPDSICGMKDQAIAGLHLFLVKVLLSLNANKKAQFQFQKALEFIPNGSRLLDLSLKVNETGQNWNREMLRSHIIAHLAYLPLRRIICYGAGNDFVELLSSGVFDGHTVVAVVDNYRTKGDLVEGVPVIREDDFGRIDHDMVIVTSSKWAFKFRMSAMRFSMSKLPYIPVI
jgi:glycosyltransferase involved in cell wall biosynthesis